MNQAVSFHDTYIAMNQKVVQEITFRDGVLDKRSGSHQNILESSSGKHELSRNLDVLDRLTVYTAAWDKLHSLATLLGTPLQSNAIQYNSSAINSTFTKLIHFQFLLTLSER